MRCSSSGFPSQPDSPATESPFLRSPSPSSQSAMTAAKAWWKGTPFCPNTPEAGSLATRWSSSTRSPPARTKQRAPLATQAPSNPLPAPLSFPEEHEALPPSPPQRAFLPPLPLQQSASPPAVASTPSLSRPRPSATVHMSAASLPKTSSADRFLAGDCCAVDR